ncbi:TPA: hypothetical protein DCX16_06595 [bacterium]|nr:hypothetical protein [bacterium]
MEELVKEALDLRKVGLYDQAVDTLGEYCSKNPDDLDMKTTLNAWKREIFSYSWAMSRKDKNRSSSDANFGKWSHVKELFNYKSGKIVPSFLPNIPSMISAGDILIAPHPSMNSFIGVWQNDGTMIKGDFILPDRLSYASSPIYIDPFVFFAVNGCIFRLTITSSLLINPVLEDRMIELIDYCSPVAYENLVIFGFKRTILIYCLDGKYTFIDLELSKDDDFLRSSVIFEKKPVFLSGYGEIIMVDDGKIKRLNEPFSDCLCSAPVLFSERLYFEVVSFDGKRMVASYDILKNSLVMDEIKDEVCSQDHIHLNFPPVVFKDGIIISGDIGPQLYYIKESGDKLSILPIELDIKTGQYTLHQFSHILSTILGEKLVGKCPGGFFFFDISTRDGKIEIFKHKTDVVSQPLIRGDRIFFLTLDGIVGYKVL